MMILDETLFDDMEDIETEEVMNPDDTPFVITDIDMDETVGDADKMGPEPGVDTGLASALIASINDEWATIDKYNSLMSTMSYEQRDDMIPVIQDIVNEENRHVGQLQKLLETISTNTELINKGQQEAEKQIDTPAVPRQEDANRIDPNTQAYTADDDDVDDVFFSQII